MKGLTESWWLFHWKPWVHIPNWWQVVWYFNLLPEWDQMGIPFVSLRACCGKPRFAERVLSSAKGPFSIANFWITRRYKGYCLIIFSRCPTTCKICRLGRALQWHLCWSSLIYRYIGYFRYLSNRYLDISNINIDILDILDISNINYWYIRYLSNRPCLTTIVNQLTYHNQYHLFCTQFPS